MNPFTKLVPRLQRIEQRLDVIEEQLAQLRFVINSIVGQATYNNIVGAGQAQPVSYPPLATPPASQYLQTSPEDAPKQSVTVIPQDDADQSFVKIPGAGAAPDKFYYLANVLFPNPFSDQGGAKLCVYANVLFSDSANAAPLRFVFATVNLGSGPQKFFFPVGAWC